jgi:hypothetical protein
LTSSKIQKLFKGAKVITILKPGKDGSDPSHFRPISLLSIIFKILERMILQSIQPLIDTVVPVSQASFRKNCSCTEQVLALTSHIETGFQRKLKMGVVFIDLRAAYDPVWERWLTDEMYPGRFLCQAVEFTEQYVIKPFFPSLSW